MCQINSTLVSDAAGRSRKHGKCCKEVDRSNFVDFLQSVGGDDRWKREGWQTQRKRGWMAGQVRYGWKSFLLRLSPMMVARSGTVVSVRKRMCRQDQNVVQFCKGSTSKRVPQRLVGGRTRPHQASARTTYWHTRSIQPKRQCYVKLREQIKKLKKE